MLGMFERTAKFVKRFDGLANRIDMAARAYSKAVKTRQFPGRLHVYGTEIQS